MGDGWERRIEAFVKIKKRGGLGRRLGRGGRGGGGGGGGGCERRSEVFVKIQKKKFFEGGGGWVGDWGGGPIRNWGGGGGVARFGVGG